MKKSNQNKINVTVLLLLTEDVGNQQQTTEGATYSMYDSSRHRYKPRWDNESEKVPVAGIFTEE